MRSRGRILELMSGRTEPNGTVRLGPPSCGLIRGAQPYSGWWTPIAQRKNKRRSGPGLTVRGLSCRWSSTHPTEKTLGRSKGALERRETSSPPPSTLLHRHRCHHLELQRHHHVSTAPPDAVLELADLHRVARDGRIKFLDRRRSSLVPLCSLSLSLSLFCLL